MRWPIPILVALLLLAGCTEPAGEPEDEASAEDEPRRTARGGNVDDDEPEEELQPVELLRTPLTFAGQGPESFDLTVPSGIVSVGFTFSSGTGFQQSGLRIELTDCGTYDSGIGFSGSTGSGVSYSDRLCNDPPPGPATVTISATLMAFDGTFILTGFTPIGDSTAEGNATAQATPTKSPEWL